MYKRQVSNSLQSLVDYAPSFLDAAGVKTPGYMSGRSQLASWQGDDGTARKHVMVENRHQPTRLNLRTRVDGRYKITLWNNPEDGEIYDLQKDPDEHCNLWADPSEAALKTRLLHQMALGEMEKEPYWMPRVYGA